MTDEKERWMVVVLLFSSISAPFVLGSYSSSDVVATPSGATTVVGHEESAYTPAQVVWSDEFNDEKVDTKMWTVLKGDGCDDRLGCGWGRGQLDVSSPSNVDIRDGHLVITATYSQAGANISPTWSSTTDVSPADSASLRVPIVSSARVSTLDSANFVHGRVDVRAKMPAGGWGALAGVWLLPSEDFAPDGLPSCDRVDVMEVSDLNMSYATAALHFGDIEDGCESSTTWPFDGGSCSFIPPVTEVGLGEGFHVYSVEWKGGEFRWFVDGWHYCTKTLWYTSGATFPQPFEKAFHVELGLGVLTAAALQDGTDDGEESLLPQEMVVDYVRIMQDASGEWRSPPEEFTLNAAESRVRRSWFFGTLVDFMAIAGCFLGPYMALTGITQPRKNTLLMGFETGAFKAANAFYLVTGSSAVALPTGLVFGALAGWVAVRSQAVARWNTVAGLAVPALFLLIDVGMISDIGSRYVCWAIFFVLSVSFGVLAFLPEHDAVAFGVASAATGGCVLKLGLGRLLGAPGEIFKILDDPLGDTCDTSTACRALTWVSVVTCTAGIMTQFCRGPSAMPMLKPQSQNGTLVFKEFNALRNDDKSKDNESTHTQRSTNSQRGKIGPGIEQRACGRRRLAGRGSSSGNVDRVTVASNYAQVYRHDHESGYEEEGEIESRGAYEPSTTEGSESVSGSDEIQPRDNDSSAAHVSASGGRWQDAFDGAKSALQRAGRSLFSGKSEIETVPSPLDSPTPVPMPAANTMISSQGDTIELVVHSPTKPLSQRYLPWGTKVDEVDPIPGDGGSSGMAGAGEARRRPSLVVERSGSQDCNAHRQVVLHPHSTLPIAFSSSSSSGAGLRTDSASDKHGLHSFLSGSDTAFRSESTCSSLASPPPTGVRPKAFRLDPNRERGSGRAGAGVLTTHTEGRLAHAFSTKWTTWASAADDGHGARQSGNGRDHGQLHEERRQQQEQEQQQQQQQQRQQQLQRVRGRRRRQRAIGDRRETDPPPVENMGNGQGSAVGRAGGDSGRRARDFDHEALHLSPFSPKKANGVDDRPEVRGDLSPPSSARMGKAFSPSTSPYSTASAHKLWGHWPSPTTQSEQLLPVYELSGDTASKPSPAAVMCASTIPDGDRDVHNDSAVRDVRLHDCHFDTAMEQAILEGPASVWSLHSSTPSPIAVELPESYDVSSTVPIATAPASEIGGGDEHATKGYNSPEAGDFPPDSRQEKPQELADVAPDSAANRSTHSLAGSHAYGRKPAREAVDDTFTTQVTKAEVDDSNGRGVCVRGVGGRGVTTGRNRAPQIRSGRIISPRALMSPEAGSRSLSRASSSSISPSRRPRRTHHHHHQHQRRSSSVGSPRPGRRCTQAIVSSHKMDAPVVGTTVSWSARVDTKDSSSLSSKPNFARPSHTGDAGEMVPVVISDIMTDHAQKDERNSSPRPRGRSRRSTRRSVLGGVDL